MTESGSGSASGTAQTKLPRLNFVELPAADLAAAKQFYATLFGWSLTGFGPSYACTMTGDVDLGLQGDPGEAPSAPLPVIEVDDLDARMARIEAAGGTISKPVFAFPGGRRCHVRDPNGAEIAIMQAD